MDLDRAIEHALDGRALLFTGAGFSRGATNLRNRPFKTGPQFANHLALQAHLPAGTPLDDAAEIFVEQFGKDRLITELKEEFTAKQVSESHFKIGRVPWRRIYTTNYDDVLESAYRTMGKRIQSITMSDSLRDVPEETILAVHLNGYVERTNRSNIMS